MDTLGGKWLKMNVFKLMSTFSYELDYQKYMCIYIYIYSDKCIYCFTVAFIVHVQIYRMLSNFS